MLLLLLSSDSWGGKIFSGDFEPFLLPFDTKPGRPQIDIAGRVPHFVNFLTCIGAYVCLFVIPFGISILCSLPLIDV